MNGTFTLAKALDVFGEYDEKLSAYDKASEKFVFSPTKESVQNSPLFMMEVLGDAHDMELCKKAGLRLALKDGRAVCFAQRAPKGKDRIQKIDAAQWSYLDIDVNTQTISGNGEVYVLPEFALFKEYLEGNRRGPRNPKERHILEAFEDVRWEIIDRQRKGEKMLQSKVAAMIINHLKSKGREGRGYSENNIIQTLRDNGKFKLLDNKEE